ncbi:MAG: hypothetical protein IH985_01415, partial [Planctomycetes bacterium]|nr:hypothetical protein [Planctomycetota bacterium]
MCGLVSLTLLAFAAIPARAQNQLWITQFGTIEADGPSALAPDGAAGVMVVGTTLGSLGGAIMNKRIAFRTIAVGAAIVGAASLTLGQADLPPQARELRPCNILTPAGEGTYATNTWPAGIVAYAIDGNVSGANQQAALNAMAEIEAVSRVDFVTRSGQPDYIQIRDSTVNSSFVGRQGGSQPVEIFNWNVRFIIVHELMHALAIWHEQQRPGRDQYVRIEWANIQPGMEHNFQIPPGALAH